MRVSIRFDYFDPDEDGESHLIAVLDCAGWQDATTKAAEHLELVRHSPRIEIERITIQIEDPRFSILNPQYGYRT